MFFHKQKTLKKEINFSGIGLHSGRDVKIKIKPSAPNTGITFVRSDLSENNVIIPNYNNVTSAVLCTTITNTFGRKISTI